MIFCEDNGWFSVKTFLNPQEWIGKDLDIGGDNLSKLKAHEAYKSVCAIEAKTFSYYVKNHMLVDTREQKNV